MASDTISSLRTLLAQCGPLPRAANTLIPLGPSGLDEALAGGLPGATLHEAFTAAGTQDAAAATAFGLGLAVRFAKDRPIVWIRQEFSDVEAGGPYGAGLAALGIDPDRIIVVRTGDPVLGLRAAGEALRCPALGAVLMEFWGRSKALDLTATRRLALAAENSGVTPVLVRLAAEPVPSAAMSRWSVAASPSQALEGNAPGRPAFEIALLRHRAGLPGQTWIVEWDSEQRAFDDPAPLPRAVDAVHARRAAGAAYTADWRRAG